MFIDRKCELNRHGYFRVVYNAQIHIMFYLRTAHFCLLEIPYQIYLMLTTIS